MPRETIRITKDQRDALYEQVRNHLAAVGDLWLALEARKDYATAERLAIELAGDFRLMADLGWNPEDQRERVALTMPPHDLMEVTGACATKRGAASPMLNRFAPRTRMAVAPKASKLRGRPAKAFSLPLATWRRERPMSAAHKERLRPGELDGLVLSYLCKHRKDGPLTAMVVGKGIDRSPGAVANCLKRLVRAKKVRLAKKSPRAYLLKDAKAR